MSIVETTLNREPEVDSPVIVGLFQLGREAHLTINDLRDHGFRMRQIGAAFRENPVESRSPAVMRIRQVELPMTPAAADSEEAEEREESVHHWWSRLRRAFYHDQPRRESMLERARYPLSADPGFPMESAGFDPGHGAMDEVEYVRPEFEACLQELGIAPERTRFLVRSLAPGDAIVTVTTAEHGELAERILLRHHGRIGDEDPAPRSEAASGHLSPVAGPNPAPARIKLFGEVLRIYKERKARREESLRQPGVAGS